MRASEWPLHAGHRRGAESIHVATARHAVAQPCWRPTMRGRREHPECQRPTARDGCGGSSPLLHVGALLLPNGAVSDRDDLGIRAAGLDQSCKITLTRVAPCGCHHRPAWGPVSPDHRSPGDHPAQALLHGPQARSRVAAGDERSELALDGDEGRATEDRAGGPHVAGGRRAPGPVAPVVSGPSCPGGDTAAPRQAGARPHRG